MKKLDNSKLKDLTVKELRKLARENDIKGYSRMPKPIIIEKLRTVTLEVIPQDIQEKIEDKPKKVQLEKTESKKESAKNTTKRVSKVFTRGMVNKYGEMKGEEGAWHWVGTCFNESTILITEGVQDTDIITSLRETSKAVKKSSQNLTTEEVREEIKGILTDLTITW